MSGHKFVVKVTHWNIFSKGGNARLIKHKKSSDHTFQKNFYYISITTLLTIVTNILRNHYFGVIYHYESKKAPLTQAPLFLLHRTEAPPVISVRVTKAPQIFIRSHLYLLKLYIFKWESKIVHISQPKYTDSDCTLYINI